MSRNRRVEKIAAISPVTASAAVDVNRTFSIDSDPDNRWVAKRQSDMTAALYKRRALENEGSNSADLDAARTRSVSAFGEARTPLKLSGESQRIGQGNWDETVPFGKHFGYL
jgi:hypothetical protein